MNAEELRAYCLAKPDVSEGFPFDSSTLAFKVGAKIFALVNLDNYSFINLKCDPERSISLREEYSGIRGAYHMNKRLWNSVDLDALVPSPLLKELIDHSYDLIFNSLTKKKQAEILAKEE